MNPPAVKPVLGVIGAIGGGKSVVAGKFAKLGALVIDADGIGHEILNQRDAKAEIVERFGAGVLGTDGNVDRKALGKQVFSDRDKLKELERIVHSRMHTVFADKIREGRANAAVTAVVLDAAVLLEAGWEGLCDRLLFVDAPRQQRLERVLQSRGWNETELSRREAMQIPNETKRNRADAVIDNDGSLAECEAKAERVFNSWVTAIRHSSKA